MKLINGKYTIKPIQENNNYERLMECMDLNLRVRCRKEKISDFPKHLSALRTKMRKDVLVMMNDKHLKYANDIIVNYEDDLVLQWFKHCGTTNVSLSLTKGKCTLQYKKNNTFNLVTEEYRKVSDAVKIIGQVLDGFPDVPKPELV